MAAETTPIRVAQTLGITMALWASGANYAFSGFVVPRMLESQAPLLLKQWTRMMDAGIKTIPPMAVASGALWFWLAWNARQASKGLGEKSLELASSGGKMGRYIVAGVLCAGIVPYTVVFLGPTNSQLYKMAAEQAKAAGDFVAKGLQGQTAHQLVDSWGMRNLPRSVMLLAGGVLGLMTVME